MSDDAPQSAKTSAAVPAAQPEAAAPGWRERVRLIIYEADTPAGKLFDLLLLIAILLSILAVCLESVRSIGEPYRFELHVVEWIFTILLTIEYVLRLITVKHPIRYALSFYGIVDLLSIIPTYLSLFAPNLQSLLVIRSLRLLRVFRVFKLGRFIGESHVLSTALRNSRHKIIVFLIAVMTIVVIMGASMYLIEAGQDSGFTSIPRSMYWAIVTMTTVGYGDIAPVTVLGQIVASMLMITGYGIIAVPTGIVTAEIAHASHRMHTHVSTRACPVCSADGHDPVAKFCKYCGANLDPAEH